MRYEVWGRALMLAAILLLDGCGEAEKSQSRVQWLTDMDEAEKAARAQGKDIFMLFTGKDWCTPCQKMDKEVFSRKEFLDYASTHLILVELDFPQHEGLITPQQLAHNEKWKARFPINGYPTVFLTDASANRYGQTGIQEGGAPNYIEFMQMLKAGQEFRDRTLVVADHSSGAERARLLQQVLSLEERWGDSMHGVLVDHRNKLVDEIIAIAKATDDRALYAKYTDIKTNAALLTALAELRNQGRDRDLDALLALFEQYDHISTGESMSFLVGQIAATYEKAGKTKEMKSFLERIVADNTYPDEFRQQAAVSMAHASAKTEGLGVAERKLEQAVALAPASSVAKNRDHILNELKKTAAAVDR